VTAVVCGVIVIADPRFLVVLFLGDDLEISERLAPERVQLNAEPGKTIGLGYVDMLAAEHTHVNQTGVLQDAEVLGNCGPTDR